MKSKHTQKRKNPWRRASRPFTAGDWLRLFALSAVIALLAWAGAALRPPEAVQEAPSPVVIDRVMTSNPSACFSVGGEYYDWVELLNVSGGEVSLAGWRLGDTVDQRGAFELGDVTLPVGGSLIVYCAPKPDGFDGSERFSGFGLSSNGEVLALSDGQRRLRQVLEVPAMVAAQVYERGDDGAYRLVRSFRPCVDGDGVAALYDEVSGAPFYPSNGRLYAG